ncbi:MAG: hypothetical protein A2170_15690 [Deltaproteobacteria bacterium RBG_13_53_10]|nr:MAG: hypothetical protein A2170_15690 [Deltaproteobacteria bacterium RBG_13_53_10]
MDDATDVLKPISPETVLREIAQSIPEFCRKNMVIIGSLAVGYHYFGSQRTMIVRTKDADCLLSPRVEALSAGVAVTEKLFEENWEFRKDEKWSKPGDVNTPDDELPAVRLHPPNSREWFLELLTVPESPTDRAQRWIRLKTRYGHFGLCSFGFLLLANYEPILTSFGIYIARPEMMALANLLEHPEIRPETMSGLIAGREIKRSNKDLGRVLAIARLEVELDEDALMRWPKLWLDALKKRFPSEWIDLARQIGAGIRALLASEPDLDEALYTCVQGLLASRPPTVDMLRIVGKRLLQDAIEPLEASAEEAGSS